MCLSLIYLYHNIHSFCRNVNDVLSPESSLHLMVGRERKFSIHSKEEGTIYHDISDIPVRQFFKNKFPLKALQDYHYDQTRCIFRDMYFIKRKHFKLQLHVIASWLHQHSSILITPYRFTIPFTVQTHHLQKSELTMHKKSYGFFSIRVHQKEKQSVFYKASPMSRIMMIIWNNATVKVQRAAPVSMETEVCLPYLHRRK